MPHSKLRLCAHGRCPNHVAKPGDIHCSDHADVTTLTIRGSSRAWRRARLVRIEAQFGICWEATCMWPVEEVDHLHGRTDDSPESLRGLCSAHHRQRHYGGGIVFKPEGWRPDVRPRPPESYDLDGSVG
jgi:hypothetical protein